MAVLAIDIGNTRMGLGLFRNGVAEDPAVRLTHAELDGELPKTLQTLWEKANCQGADAEEDCEIIVASVVPEVSRRVLAVARDTLDKKPRQAGQDFPVPLKTMLRDESTVGVDRLLGALAAYVNTQVACAIVSVGSALVVDCIDQEGIFRGGAIAPGLAMSAKALHEYAAQLPAASLTPPDQPFGRFTQEAINVGLYVGARGAVRELLERYATALGGWPHVVATGGDALTLLQDLQLVDSFIPDLVLQGAALAWEHYQRSQMQA